MLVHLPRAIRTFEARHKWHLVYFAGKAPYECMLALMYMLLPAVIAIHSDVTVAGMVKSAVLALSAFVFAPLAGNFSDRWSALTLMRIAAILTIVMGVIWLVAPLSTWSLSLIMVLFYLRGHLNNTETYLLRTTSKADGGLMFGIDDNIWQIGSFAAAMVLPLFTPVGHAWWGGALMTAMGAWYTAVTFRLPDDQPVRQEVHRREGWWHTLNPLTSLAHGWRFIKACAYVPLFRLFYTSYNAFFSGALWFLMPIHLITLGIQNPEDSLPLGIYGLVSAFIAGASGYLADRTGWRSITIIGWSVMIVGTLFLPVSMDVWWLVGAGAVISVGSNLTYAAVTHALEESDSDHGDDGAYFAAENTLSSFVEALVPVTIGFGYAAFGFQATMITISGISAIFCASQLGFFVWQYVRRSSAEHLVSDVADVA